MDIEEAKKILENKLEMWKKDCQIMINKENFKLIQAIEIVLQELENSIPKDKIREILKYYEYTPADNSDCTIAFYSDVKKLLEE